jgi:hypothetical protein
MPANNKKEHFLLEWGTETEQTWSQMMLWVAPTWRKQRPTLPSESALTHTHTHKTHCTFRMWTHQRNKQINIKQKLTSNQKQSWLLARYGKVQLLRWNIHTSVMAPLHSVKSEKKVTTSNTAKTKLLFKRLSEKKIFRLVLHGQSLQFIQQVYLKSYD